MRQLLRFAYQEAASCVFAAGVFGLLALTSVVPLPIARYDALLIGCLALTALLWATGVETGREVLVVGLFHLVGLALELFKVRTGSWSYPGEALTKIGGVPLYSGFMYAAVGSYLCQAWRRLDLRLIGYRPGPTAAAALLVYANFFTHHWLPDLRLCGAVALLAATWRSTVTFRIGPTRYAMPLALSFVLIGAFLWLAENAATFLGAWQYPDQGDVWRMVHLSKFGSWALLVSVSFVLVAGLKHGESRLARPAYRHRFVRVLRHRSGVYWGRDDTHTSPTDDLDPGTEPDARRRGRPLLVPAVETGHRPGGERFAGHGADADAQRDDGLR